MPQQVKLDEVEIYRQEAHNAQRENRPCRLRDPREVYKEDPNRDSYLVYLTDEEYAEAEAAMQENQDEKFENFVAQVEAQNENRPEDAPEITDEVIEERLPSTDPGEYQRQVELEHGLSEDLYSEPHITSAPDVSAAVVQEVDEDLAAHGADVHSDHQQNQDAPNPDYAGGQVSEEDQRIDEIAQQSAAEQEVTEPETTGTTYESPDNPNVTDETSHQEPLADATADNDENPDVETSGAFVNTPEVLQGDVDTETREASHLEEAEQVIPPTSEGDHHETLPDATDEQGNSEIRPDLDTA